MRRRVVTALASFLLISSQAIHGQAQRALLNVEGLSIPPGGALAAFRIDTWGVIPLAVCQVPPLWELQQAKFMDSAATLSGLSAGESARHVLMLPRLLVGR
jgi:hypothetical protein